MNEENLIDDDRSSESGMDVRFVRPSLQPAPFDVRQFRSSDLPGDLSPDEALSESWAYSTYSSVLSALAGKKPVTELPYLKTFLGDITPDEDHGSLLQRLLGEVFLPNVLYGYLDRRFELTLQTSLATGIVQHWIAGMLGQSALIAYRRTGEQRFMDLYMSFMNRVLLLRDSQLGYFDDYHGKTMDAWGDYATGRRADGLTMWIADVTEFSVIMGPALGFAREILQSRGLVPHQDWAEDMVAFFDRGFRQFEVDLRRPKGASDMWYWRPLWNMFEPTNHIHIVGQALLDMHAVTRDRFYADRIRAIIRVFEKGARVDADGLAFWNYSPYFQVESAKEIGRNRHVSEHSMKGDHTVPFLYCAAADGFPVDPELMKAVTASIRDYILADGIYKLNTHPHNSRPLKKSDIEKTGRRGFGVAGYHHAARVEPDIERLIIDVVVKNVDVFPWGWFGNPKLARSYAFMLQDTR